MKQNIAACNKTKYSVFRGNVAGKIHVAFDGLANV